MKKIIIATLVSLSFVASALAVSDTTQKCIDRMNGHVLNDFPSYPDVLTDSDLQNAITKFCLTTTPSAVSSVADYSGFTKLAQLYWDGLEDTASVVITEEFFLNQAMVQKYPTVLPKIKDSIILYSNQAKDRRDYFQKIFSQDPVYNNPATSAVTGIYNLTEAQYTDFTDFAAKLSDNLNKNYTCTATICTLTSALVAPQSTQQVTQQAQPTQQVPPQTQQPVVSQPVFTDVPVSYKFYSAIKYLKDNNIVSGYADGSYKPLNPINRAEFTKIVIGSLGVSGLGSDCFPDVATEWFAPYVCYAKANYIIGGYKDGTFKPNQNINLTESLKIVLLALKVNLSTNTGLSWYDVYVNTANEKNLINGIDATLAHDVTRGEMAQLIYNIKTAQ